MRKKILIICSWIWTIRFRLFSRKIKFGKNFVCNWRLKIKGPGFVTFGDNVNLWAHAEPNQFLTFTPSAQIVIGNSCRLNGVTLQARTSVVVQDQAMIGSAVIMDNDFHGLNPARRNENIPTKPIVIGKNAWVAGQAAILKGVEIGENSVIGFRAVVTKNVPANTVVAGNPAKIIKELSFN